MLLPRQDDNKNNDGDSDVPGAGGLPVPSRGGNNNSSSSSSNNGTSTGTKIFTGVFVIVVLAVIGYIIYYIYMRYRANKLGLPPPSMNPFSARNRVPGAGGGRSGGLVGWVKEKVGGARRGRQAGGAYEGSGGVGGLGGARNTTGRRSGFRGLDPDEAWDERVGTEAEYGYDEQELSGGLRNVPAHEQQDTGYMGSRGAYEPFDDGLAGERSGRNPMKSELDDRYDAEMGRGGRSPYGDSTPDLRGVSPRPHEDRGRLDVESQRRSAFREGSMH